MVLAFDFCLSVHGVGGGGGVMSSAATEQTGREAALERTAKQCAHIEITAAAS